jgi:hypothetical protein
LEKQYLNKFHQEQNTTLEGQALKESV